MSLHSSLKRAIKLAFILLAMPLFLLFMTIRLLTGSDHCFASFSQLLSLFPGKAGIYLRAAFYHLACPETSDEISVGFMTILSQRDITIAKGVYIGPQCNIGMCHIGENTLVGSGVHILSGNRQHDFSDYDRPIQEQGGQYEKIIIGADCWIGNQALVMAELGTKSVVAAGSVITKPFTNGSIIAGNPGRLVRYRPNNNDKSTRTEEAH